MDIPEVPLTAVITAEEWAAIMDVVSSRLGGRHGAQEAKEYVALIVECGYGTIDALRSVVPRELRTELGIPLRWGMELLRLANEIADATEDERSEAEGAKQASQLRSDAAKGCLPNEGEQD